MVAATKTTKMGELHQPHLYKSENSTKYAHTHTLYRKIDEVSIKYKNFTLIYFLVRRS